MRWLLETVAGQKSGPPRVSLSHSTNIVCIFYPVKIAGALTRFENLRNNDFGDLVIIAHQSEKYGSMTQLKGWSILICRLCLLAMEFLKF